MTWMQSVVAAAFLAVLGTSAWSQELGLSGFCPVSILKAEKWMQGSPKHQVSYDGLSYQFPAAEIKQTFLSDPIQFAPVLNGDCVVCLAKVRKRVPGSVRHAAKYKDRLYLFSSVEEKQMFLNNPAEFAQVDVAMDGNCTVCQINAGKTVPGNPQHVARYNGLRYFFHGENEKQTFLNNPEKFAVDGPVDGNPDS